MGIVNIPTSILTGEIVGVKSNDELKGILNPYIVNIPTSILTGEIVGVKSKDEIKALKMKNPDADFIPVNNPKIAVKDEYELKRILHPHIPEIPPSILTGEIVGIKSKDEIK